MLKRVLVFVPFALWVCTCPGCRCSRFPEPPKQPKIDAAAAGKQAIEQYDTNKDGKIDAEEIKQSPPLQKAKERIDTDNDGMLTADEIAARITSWLTSGTTLMSGTVQVNLNDGPLEGATVTFQPEEFLGSSFKPCEGVTNASGEAYLQGPDEKYPGRLYLGLYRVRISKKKDGTETIPDRYNAKTELGWEVADDLGGVGDITFNLKKP